MTGSSRLWESFKQLQWVQDPLKILASEVDSAKSENSKGSTSAIDLVAFFFFCPESTSITITYIQSIWVEQSSKPGHRCYTTPRWTNSPIQHNLEAVSSFWHSYVAQTQTFFPHFISISGWCIMYMVSLLICFLGKVNDQKHCTLMGLGQKDNPCTHPMICTGWNKQFN